MGVEGIGVIYGANNLGKTLQANSLVEKLNKAGVSSMYIKYPIYDLEPTGPLLNRILRDPDMPKPKPEEIQQIFAQNRFDYQPSLVQIIRNGFFPILEDYKGTGIAWGMTFGVPLDYLESINSGLLEPNVAVCLDGKRFKKGIEKIHLHENSGLWEKNRKIHQFLAKRYGWEIVNANQSIEKVAYDIWLVIRSKLSISD